jgi:hypothetical protein
MGAAVDIAADGIAAADDEAVEAAGAQFEDEVAGLAVRDEGEGAEGYAWRCGGEAFHSIPPRDKLGEEFEERFLHFGSFALGNPAQAAS